MIFRLFFVNIINKKIKIGYNITNKHKRGITMNRISDKLSAMFIKIDGLKQALDSKRPLTQGEAEKLLKLFLVDFTYNSNAIEGNTLT